MNTQMERPRGHSSHEDDLQHNVVTLHSGEGHDQEHHGEKKSVLKKVKAKAKKIKDSIKGHVGHGHELDHDHDHDHDHDEDDDDEEVHTDPDIHGSFIAGTLLPVQDQLPVHGHDQSGLPHGTITGEELPTERTSHMPLNQPPVQKEGFGQSRTGAGNLLPVHEHDQAGLHHGTRMGEKIPSEALSRGPLGRPHVQEESSGFSGIGVRNPLPVHEHDQAGLHHRTKIGERSPKETISHMPLSRPPGQEETSGHFGTGRPLSEERPYAPKNTPVGHSDASALKTPFVHSSQTPTSKPSDYQTFDPTATRYIPGSEETLDRSRTDTGRRSRSHEETPYSPMDMSGGSHDSLKDTPFASHAGGTHATVAVSILDRPTKLQRDPNAPRDVGETHDPENYQTKVTDPTGRGGEEIGVTPLLHRMDNLNIHEKTDLKHENEPSRGQEESMFKPGLGQGSTGAYHEKLSTGSHDQFSPEPITLETSTFLQDPETKVLETSTFPQDPETQVFDDTGVDSGLDSREIDREMAHGNAGQGQGTYTDKITSAAATVVDKAKQATSTLTSKLGGGTGAEQHDRPSEKGGYGQTISTVTAAIADKAVHAKDAVASKLGYGTGTTPEEIPELHASAPGYGGTREEQPELHTSTLGYGSSHEEQPELHISGEKESSKTGSIGDYGKKVVTTVQETLAPVYDKVTEVGSTVASKVQGSGTAHGAGVTEKAADMGVSVKEYLAEKLKPGEEDKALSEVITEALPLHKRKEEPTRTEGQGGERKVAITKVEIRERVKESDEVKNRLGSYDETSHEDLGSGEASPGKAMLDRIKDAATSWFGKGGETQPTAVGFMDTPKGDEGMPSNDNEQRSEVHRQQQMQ